MPAGDRTGPRGMGPRTGHGAGYCAGYDVPGYANVIPGRGFAMGWGRGGGRGRGWRNRYYATGLPGWARFGYAPAWGQPPTATYGPYAVPPNKEHEAEFLKTQAEWLKGQLEAISQRISELEQEE